VPSKIASYLVHAAIVAQTAPVASTRVHVHRRRTRCRAGREDPHDAPQASGMKPAVGVPVSPTRRRRKR
jgi:hypothetical protein